eukprot:CAMPEP_0170608926 /NCGR_PEP_ID=MMETSP0224-20130122/21847_1 /TAXON_ID=285029 /ORGANISM="Togula jolla, Strain CCCM 725" /LENGTH=205 /DNA_ID=CAMNT_0010934189 /DNA_START=161 /DNA_END=778 /DNA_ORIENTATION=-
MLPSPSVAHRATRKRRRVVTQTLQLEALLDFFRLSGAQEDLLWFGPGGFFLEELSSLCCRHSLSRKTMVPVEVAMVWPSYVLPPWNRDPKRFGRSCSRPCGASSRNWGSAQKPQRLRCHQGEHASATLNDDRQPADGEGQEALHIGGSTSGHLHQQRLSRCCSSRLPMIFTDEIDAAADEDNYAQVAHRKSSAQMEARVGPSSTG